MPIDSENPFRFEKQASYLFFQSDSADIEFQIYRHMKMKSYRVIVHSCMGHGHDKTQFSSITKATRYTLRYARTRFRCCCSQNNNTHYFQIQSTFCLLMHLHSSQEKVLCLKTLIKKQMDLHSERTNFGCLGED